MPYIIALVFIVVAGVAFTYMRTDVSAPTVETPSVVDTITETVDTPTEPAPVAQEEPVVREPVVETEPAPPREDSAPAVVASEYQDGTHTTAVTYNTPKRDTYLLDVSLTLANDIVTDASVTYGNGAEKDSNAQRFEKAYRTQVIGKKLDALNLSRVGGASLTTNAFNDAVAKIKADAQS
jgi:hypothetical protein